MYKVQSFVRNFFLTNPLATKSYQEEFSRLEDRINNYLIKKDELILHLINCVIEPKYISSDECGKFEQKYDLDGFFHNGFKLTKAGSQILFILLHNKYVMENNKKVDLLADNNYSLITNYVITKLFPSNKKYEINNFQQQVSRLFSSQKLSQTIKYDNVLNAYTLKEQGDLVLKFNRYKSEYYSTIEGKKKLRIVIEQLIIRLMCLIPKTDNLILLDPDKLIQIATNISSNIKTNREKGDKLLCSLDQSTYSSFITTLKSYRILFNNSSQDTDTDFALSLLEAEAKKDNTLAWIILAHYFDNNKNILSSKKFTSINLHDPVNHFIYATQLGSMHGLVQAIKEFFFTNNHYASFLFAATGYLYMNFKNNYLDDKIADILFNTKGNNENSLHYLKIQAKKYPIVQNNIFECITDNYAVEFSLSLLDYLQNHSKLFAKEPIEEPKYIKEGEMVCVVVTPNKKQEIIKIDNVIINGNLILDSIFSSNKSPRLAFEIKYGFNLWKNPVSKLGNFKLHNTGFKDMIIKTV